jgi:energy-coupling factor transport system permease protein
MATLAPTLIRPGQTGRWFAHRLPRSLHPLAWWMWALGLAVAASRTTNPLLLAMVVAATAWVVLARRPDAPWAKAFHLYLLGGVLVVVLRVVFRIVFAGNQGTVVLLPLPTIALPDALGITVLGDVTAESVLAGLYDGMRLATMLICLGGANALANPRRLLRSMPAALHEVSTAVVVALSVFPQLAESLVRVRRARRLRPGTAKGFAGLRSIVIPVLEDALDRSLLLAASMDSRGYGRRGRRPVLVSRITGGLLLLGLGGIAVGVYGLLDEYAPRYLATPFLAGGLVAGVVGIGLSGRGVVRSAYRPDRWRLAEISTAASGLAAGVLISVASGLRSSGLNPSLTPLEWPQLSALPMLAVLLCLAPLLTAPNPPCLVAPPAGAVGNQ